MEKGADSREGWEAEEVEMALMLVREEEGGGRQAKHSVRKPRIP